MKLEQLRLDCRAKSARRLLTSRIQVSLGTRGNFNMVLPVKFRANVTFLARYQGRPQTT